MTRITALFAALVATGALLVTPALAHAERAGSGDIVVLPPMDITASPPAPQAVFVLPRQSTEHVRVERTDSFVREVTESVRRAPF
jgi:hypothetical protein